MQICRNLDSRLLAAVLVDAARRYAEHRTSNAGASNAGAPASQGEAAVPSSLTEGRAWPGREPRDVRAL